MQASIDTHIEDQNVTKRDKTFKLCKLTANKVPACVWAPKCKPHKDMRKISRCKRSRQDLSQSKLESLSHHCRHWFLFSSSGLGQGYTLKCTWNTERSDRAVIWTDQAVGGVQL